MALHPESGEAGTVRGLPPEALVRGRSIQNVLQGAKAGRRVDLLLATTRELVALLGDRGCCILLGKTPRIEIAPFDPLAEGLSVDLGQYPEIGEALGTGELVVGEGGLSIAIPLLGAGDHQTVVLVQSYRPCSATRLDLVTAGLVASLSGALLSGMTGPEGAIAAPLEPGRSLPISVPPPPPASARQRILLVEDDLAFATSVGEGLESEGYLVEQARDGREGVDRAVSAPPDLILLEVNLPTLDGFLAAAELRASPVTREVPIIFLSARRDLSSRLRVLHLENVDFIPKPFREDDLLARVEQALIGATARQRLQRRAAIDDLTGLGNLRMFRARLAEEHQRLTRYGNPLSLAMIDVDKLKSINDRHGHLVGSEVLRAIGDVLRLHARTTDLAIRYGGDEFVVLLPETTLAEASVFAERVRAEVARLTVHGLHPTVSIGVASLGGRDSFETDAHLLKRADAAAYAAKRQGGNRTCSENELLLAGLRG
jgi:two-component system, cell cycle response regulator